MPKKPKQINKSWSEPFGDDLFIGLTAAVGTDLDFVSDTITKIFTEMGYSIQLVRISEIIAKLDEGKDIKSANKFERQNGLMTAGNKFCQNQNLEDALARTAMARIREHRLEKGREDNLTPIGKCVFIFRSLKRPAEVKLLRDVYRSSFHLIGIHEEASRRKKSLADLLAEGDTQMEKHEHNAELLIKRDVEEEHEKFGQNVRNTFPLSDVFVDVGEKNKAEESLRKYLELYMGSCQHTPTQDENAMYHAFASSLRSGALGRQVGAVITDENGDVLAVGTNEVPKPGGGLFWTGDPNDNRDIITGRDSNDDTKRFLVRDFLKRTWRTVKDEFSDATKENSEPSQQTAAVENLIDADEDKLIGRLFEKVRPLLKGSQIMSLIEFGKIVHAEMDAITTCARLGTSTEGSYLYSTTFPCHECTRHIIAAGITKVIYVVPYPKSLATRLFDYAINQTSTAKEGTIQFNPFVGIAPNRFAELFHLGERERKREGKVIEFNYKAAAPRQSEPYYSYLQRERRAVLDLQGTQS